MAEGRKKMLVTGGHPGSWEAESYHFTGTGMRSASRHMGRWILRTWRV